MRVLVAGVGNVLRGDDGFGVLVARRLASETLPREVEVAEYGIGGIHLVQALIGEVDPVAALVVVDTVDVGKVPGTVVVLRPDVEDLRALPVLDRHDRLADMHYATPDRAFALARALDALPDVVRLVGCQPLDAERVGEGLSAPVEAAVDVARAEVRRLVTDLGVWWSSPASD